MVTDVVAETRANLEAIQPEDADAVRRAGQPIVNFSAEMQTQLSGLRNFLHENMYRHYKVNRARSQAKRIVRALFDLFFAEPETLPPEWRARYEGADDAKRARVVCDYIAGMTDRYAIAEHDRLFGAGPSICRGASMWKKSCNSPYWRKNVMLAPDRRFAHEDCVLSWGIGGAGTADMAAAPAKENLKNG